MKELFQRLTNNYNFSVEEALQLVYVWEYYNKDEMAFNDLLNAIKSFKCTINVDILHQVVKCITHELPYDIILNNELNTDEIIEIRRFMEDTQEVYTDKFKELTDKLVKARFDKYTLYELRVFTKCKKKLSFEQMNKLIDFGIDIGKDMHWMIYASIYNVYMKHDFTEAISFAEQWKIWIKQSNSVDIMLDMYNSTL